MKRVKPDVYDSDELTPAPLYRDPVYDGAADPVLIYNHGEGQWWMVYTQRRGTLSLPGVASSHGSALGVASSRDGRRWLYRGSLNVSVERGHNTYWAPELLYHPPTKTYHMYVSYIQGVPLSWGDSSRNGIAHCTSRNLWDWEFQAFVGPEGRGIIDASVHPLPGGSGYRMWYRGADNRIWAIDSGDLHRWGEAFRVLDDPPSEGPNVFELKGSYWLLTDPLGERHGLAVYRSDDLSTWEKQGYILQEPGLRPLDDSPGRHADVWTDTKRGYIFYFTQPYRDYQKRFDVQRVANIDEHRCVIQAARLDVLDGILVCDRNEDFSLRLD